MVINPNNIFDYFSFCKYVDSIAYNISRFLNVIFFFYYNVANVIILKNRPKIKKGFAIVIIFLFFITFFGHKRHHFSLVCFSDIWNQPPFMFIIKTIFAKLLIFRL